MSKIHLPSTLDARVASFIRRFYALSDTPGDEATESYVSCFSLPSTEPETRSTTNSDSTGIFQIGPMPPVRSRSGIRSWRISGWKPVKSRLHTVYRVYLPPSPSSSPAGDEDEKVELMLHGRVDYTFIDESAKPAYATWAGRMILDVKGEGEEAVKLSDYRVWLTKET